MATGSCAKGGERRHPLRVVAWGTYDTGKPRTRILLRGLREAGVEVEECNVQIWSGVEDKSQVEGVCARIAFLARWLASYPRLIARYLTLARHDVVFVGYLGHLDVLVLWPWARLRGVPIVWDAFISLYDTIVDDREMVTRGGVAARLLFAWEWLACRAARRVVLDTEAHADYFRQTYRLGHERVCSVLVGVEPERFGRQVPDHRGRAARPFRVLFYGQFIPLHGIATIVEAARLTSGRGLEWILIGKGQEDARIRRMLASRPVPELRWIPWIPYEELRNWIAEADLCLGIFGTTGKAARVIPNKVFQVLASGKAVVTRDSPAMRELAKISPEGVYLVPPGDPELLAEVVSRCAREGVPRGPDVARLLEAVSPRSIGKVLARVCRTACAAGAGR